MSVPGATPATPSAVLALPSGLRITDPEARLLAFCREEYAYYDGIADACPDHILPVDVLATVAMNSFIDRADQVRRIHRGLAAACDPILPAIPAAAGLLAFDPPLEIFRRLIHAAVQVPEVLVPRAVKVLHRKRRDYIPMLDTIVLEYHLDAFGRSDLKPKSQLKGTAAAVAVSALEGFRDDLRAVADDLDQICRHLTDAGYPLTPVRILEILVWTEAEPRGYYRRPLQPS